MITKIIIYLVLAFINLPFALDKSNKSRNFNWFSMGFTLGVMTAYIINQIYK